MSAEFVTNGTTLRLVEVRRPTEIKRLTEKQLEWCRQKWPWFEHNKVQRLERKDV